MKYTNNVKFLRPISKTDGFVEYMPRDSQLSNMTMLVVSQQHGVVMRLSFR